MRTRPESLVGRRIGLLTVIRVIGKKYGKTLMQCVCQCGNITSATVGHLVQERRVSCGCYAPTKHGRRYTPEYKIWSDMLKRCNNPKHISYKYYGGKGVSVCTRWRDFSNFYADMGDRPKGYSLDRIDPSGNYEPSNCRWATAQQQTENRPVQLKYPYKGQLLTLPKISELCGVPYRTLKSRIRRGGMSLEEAISHVKGSRIKRCKEGV